MTHTHSSSDYPDASSALKSFFEQPQDTLFTEEYEGQLCVDVYDSESAIIVVSTIAGAKQDEIDIHIHGDVLTIRGKRHLPRAVAGKEHYYQECFWGGFSRSIVLPVEVNVENVKAVMEHGVLLITLPKAKKQKEIKVSIQ